MSLVNKVFGTHSERELKRIKSIVSRIEELHSSMQALSDEELKNKTKEYKKRLEEGETLDDFHAQIPNPSFEPDVDNVIPVTETDCFEDDILFPEPGFDLRNIAAGIDEKGLARLIPDQVAVGPERT